MLNLTLDECETKDWNIPMAGISDRFHFFKGPIMSRVIQGYPCIDRLNHRAIYGVLMGLTYYAEKWNSDSIQMILDKEATLRLKDLKRDFDSGLFRRSVQCRISWINDDVIMMSYLKITGFRHLKIVLFMRFSIMEIVGAEFRIQMFEIPFLDRLSRASWNSQKGMIPLEIRLDLNFKIGSQFSKLCFSPFFGTFPTFKKSEPRSLPDWILTLIPS